MTNPPSTARQTPAPKPGARRVWLARTYHTLTPPVHTLIELANAMLADARERGQEEFRADLEKIHASGHVLLTRFQQRLDPACDADSEVDTLRRLRHDLRTPLTHIIGYCELWLEDAEKCFLDSFVADLREIHNLGKQTLALLDEIVRLVERTGEAALEIRPRPA